MQQVVVQQHCVLVVQVLRIAPLRHLRNDSNEEVELP